MHVRLLHCGLSWCWGAGPASAQIAEILDGYLRNLAERNKGSAREKLNKHLMQFVEPFDSGPSVLCALSEPNSAFLNARNHGSSAFYEVLRNPPLFLQFNEKIAAYGPGPEPGQWDFSQSPIWLQTQEGTPESALVNRAYQFYCVARAARATYTPTASKAVVKMLANAVASARRTLEIIYKMLPSITPEPLTFNSLAELIARFDLVQWDDRSWQAVIGTLDRISSLFYLSPDNYFAENKEIAAEHAGLLVDALLSLKGMAVLFGVERRPYARLEAAGWEKRSIEWSPPCPPNPNMFQVYKVWRLIRGHKPRVECRYVWLSPFKSGKLDT